MSLGSLGAQDNSFGHLKAGAEMGRGGFAPSKEAAGAGNSPRLHYLILEQPMARRILASSLCRIP